MAEYGIYGITIASEIPLALPESRGKGLCKITLRQSRDGSIHEAIGSPPLVTRDDWFDHALLEDGRSYARWRGVGEFLVSKDGREIACLPAPGAHEESFQVYLLGQAFSFALVKAGFEPIHATAVEIHGDAIALMGESGQGKSTLAASFLAAGFRLLTDDLMLVSPDEPPLLAQPGPPRIKLLPDSALRTLGAVATSVPMNPETDKHVIPLPDASRCPEPARLRAIYLPEWTEDARRDVRIEPLVNREAFLALVASTFNRYLTDPDRLRRQLAEVTRLVTFLPVKRVVYPCDYDRLPEVREAIRRDAEL